MSFLDIARDRPVPTLLGLALLVVAFLYLWDVLVVTDEERVQLMLNEATAAFLAGDEERVLSFLASDYSSTMATRTVIRKEVKKNRFVDAYTSLGRFELEEKDANRARGRVKIVGLESDGSRRSQLFRFEFKREGEEWKIRNVALWLLGG